MSNTFLPEARVVVVPLNEHPPVLPVNEPLGPMFSV
jgi:hypothetical protein